MDKKEYQGFSARMNQQLLLCYLNVMDSLAYLLSLYAALNDKDELKEEERINENTEDAVYQVQALLQPLLREIKPHSLGLSQILLDTGIFPINLMNDINEVLIYKEEANNPIQSSLYPYLNSKEDREDAMEDFLFHLVVAHRVESWIIDIADGILQYGVTPYLVPENDSEKSINILDGIEEMDMKDYFEELPEYLIPRDDDSDERQENKKYEASLLKEALTYLKKEKKK